MKNLLLVYNPNSGTKNFHNEIDSCIEIFQNHNYIVTLFRFSDDLPIDKYLSKIDNKDFFHTIVASGGDGTINIVLNSIMVNNINTNLGIIPSGTANDFATFLKINKNPLEAAKIIVEENLHPCDIGIANNQYFINVFAAGLFSGISQAVDKDFKNFFGKIAYYAKGIEQIPNYLPIPVRITNSTEVFEENIFLIFVLNSAGTGGFEKLVKNASINDGYFDFVIIKSKPIVELAVLFVKILSGDYLNEPGVLYFRDNYAKIQSFSLDPLHSITDLDGEEGPNMPVEIRNLKHKINIYIPQTIE